MLLPCPRCVVPKKAVTQRRGYVILDRISWTLCTGVLLATERGYNAGREDRVPRREGTAPPGTSSITNDIVLKLFFVVFGLILYVI